LSRIYRYIDIDIDIDIYRCCLKASSLARRWLMTESGASWPASA